MWVQNIVGRILDMSLAIIRKINCVDVSKKLVLYMSDSRQQEIDQ